MQGKVSMVVPCYNKDAYIGAMLDSVINQVWDNIEVILVNDGSTDNTRNIIAEYEPKLKARGYEVVIVDQENAGCCAAVRNGLAIATGDYICVPDSDDELYPGYVSTMAGWLEEHSEYKWASCYFNQIVKKDGKVVVEPGYERLRLPSDPYMLENFLTYRTYTPIWIYMVRSTYLKDCTVVENYCTERRATHEPDFTIPLAAAGGLIKHFNIPLYLVNRVAPGLSKHNSFEKDAEFSNDHRYLHRRAVSLLEIPNKDKQRLFNLIEIAYFRILISKATVHDVDMPYDYIVSEIRKLFPPFLSFDFEKFNQNADLYLKLLFLAADNSIYEKSSIVHTIDLSNTIRIIAHGVLGKMGEKYLPEIINTPLKPTILWDKAAEESMGIEGIQLTKPNFKELKDNDILLIFPAAEQIVDEIRKQIPEGINIKILYSDNIKEYVSDFYFRDLFVGY